MKKTKGVGQVGQLLVFISVLINGGHRFDTLPCCSQVTISVQFLYFALILKCSFSEFTLDLFRDSLLLTGTSSEEDLFLLVNDGLGVFGYPWFVVRINNLFGRNHNIKAK